MISQTPLLHFATRLAHMRTRITRNSSLSGLTNPRLTSAAPAPRDTAASLSSTGLATTRALAIVSPVSSSASTGEELSYNTNPALVVKLVNDKTNPKVRYLKHSWPDIPAQRVGTVHIPREGMPCAPSSKPNPSPKKTTCSFTPFPQHTYHSQSEQAMPDYIVSTS